MKRGWSRSFESKEDLVSQLKQLQEWTKRRNPFLVENFSSSCSSLKYLLFCHVFVVYDSFVSVNIILHFFFLSFFVSLENVLESWYWTFVQSDRTTGTRLSRPRNLKLGEKRGMICCPFPVMMLLSSRRILKCDHQEEFSGCVSLNKKKSKCSTFTQSIALMCSTYECCAASLISEENLVKWRDNENNRALFVTHCESFQFWVVDLFRLFEYYIFPTVTPSPSFSLIKISHTKV